jgi:hypothetical protein
MAAMAAPTLTRPPEVQIVDGLNVAARPSPHRNTALRTTEFHDPRDGRIFHVTSGRYQRSGHSSPRHRHTFDQIRFVVQGRVKYGPLRLEGGDVTYFPAGTFYGPQELLSDEILNCTIQTQGPEWGAFYTQDDLFTATEALSSKGAMDRATGQFVWADGRHQDSFEAILEHTTGRPVDYPEPRFHYPVQLRARNFDWVTSSTPGISLKPLAAFNAGGPAIQLLKLDPGATLSAGTPENQLLLMWASGKLVHNGAPLGAGAYMYCPAGCSRPAMVAEEETVLMAAEFQVRGQPLAQPLDR